MAFSFQYFPVESQLAIFPNANPCSSELRKFMKSWQVRRLWEFAVSCFHKMNFTDLSGTLLGGKSWECSKCVRKPCVHVGDKNIRYGGQEALEWIQNVVLYKLQFGNYQLPKLSFSFFDLRTKMTAVQTMGSSYTSHF